MFKNIKVNCFHQKEALFLESGTFINGQFQSSFDIKSLQSPNSHKITYFLGRAEYMSELNFK